MYNLQILTVTHPLILTLTVLSLGCDELGSNEDEDQLGIFSVLKGGEVFEIDGEITSETLDDFNELYTDFPQVKLISIKSCEGSIDDEVNFRLMERIYNLDLDTDLQDDGVIASGGVDLFLAGRERTLGVRTQIGVHAWSSGDISATDFPEDPELPEHLQYIESYQAVGFSHEQAAAFYFFTINAAPAEEIHWMTEEERAAFCVVGVERCSP